MMAVAQQALAVAVAATSQKEKRRPSRSHTIQEGGECDEGGGVDQRHAHRSAGTWHFPFRVLEFFRQIHHIYMHIFYLGFGHAFFFLNSMQARGCKGYKLRSAGQRGLLPGERATSLKFRATMMHRDCTYTHERTRLQLPTRFRSSRGKYYGRREQFGLAMVEQL